MYENIKKYWNSLSPDSKSFIIRVILTSLIAISVKLSIQIKKEKVSVMNAFLSIVIGVGVATLCGNMVIHYFNTYMSTIVIAVITITGEKIATWFIYKLKVDRYLKDFLEYLLKRRK